MKQFVIVLLLLGFGSAPSLAQFYTTQHRPPGLNWQQLTTPNFRVVFPQGEDSSAWRTGRILEEHYSRIQDLTGGSLNQFPVVLNNYNDLSNGFVTPFHFRSEIELAPFKGKALNPRSGSWLQTVVPHELVHALHFNNLGNNGVTKFVSLFSPDLARSLHGAVPLGIHEGLAVHYESDQVSANGGRGNYPFFTNQFNAMFDSPNRWSMGQMLQVSSYTRPVNRHYLGGYQLTSWMQDRYGRETTKKAIRFYADYPFLGYGFALRHVTGQWPGQLYDEFKEYKQEQHNSRRQTSFTRLEPLSIPYKGVAIRRPAWLSDSTLVFYGTFYNARAGFYSFDLTTNELSHLATTTIVQDFAYDLAPDRSSLVFSYYNSSPIYDYTYRADLIELDLERNTLRALTDNGRLYAPVYNEREYLALQTDHSSSRLVRFQPQSDPQITTVAAASGIEIVAFDTHPDDSDRLVVVANRQGQQGLWIARSDELQNKLKRSPDVYFSEGSIFDPVWHPDGRRILFSSDRSDALNIYEYDVQAETVTQVTNAINNAFEASYSPDGSRIAFIIQKENQQLPVVLSRNEFYGASIPLSSSDADPGQRKPERDLAQKKSNSSEGPNQPWTVSPYTSGLSWLKPRAILPIVEEVSNRDVYRLGASIHSNDLLQQQSYSAELSFIQNRLWYDFSYRNTSFYPGFEASIHSTPSYRTMPFDITVDTVSQTMLRQERSFSLSIPVNYVVDQNIFLTSFFLRPRIRQSQIRYFELNHSGTAASDFADVTIANVYGSLRYRLQQNPRDVQPNSGLLLYSEFEHYLWPTELTIRTLNSEYRRSFVNAFALRGGIYAYVSPLRRLNQSLRLDIRALNQNNFIFNNQFLVSEGFSEPVFPFSGNLLSLGTRYTIPLLYPDNGGFLLPAYLSNIYLVAFTNTVGRFTQPDFLSASRTVVGAGIRIRFRISNLPFDVGVAIGFEPARNQTNIFMGDF